MRHLRPARRDSDPAAVRVGPWWLAKPANARSANADICVTAFDESANAQTREHCRCPVRAEPANTTPNTTPRSASATPNPAT